MKLMFWNSYLYRHICALTPASVRIRKTQIQNVDEMLVMRNNSCLKVGEEKAFCCENTPTDWNAEIRKYGMHKQEHSTKLCRSCSELLGLFWGLIFFLRKESELHFRGILQTFLIWQSHVWHWCYRYKTKFQRKVGQLRTRCGNRCLPLMLLAKFWLISVERQDVNARSVSHYMYFNKNNQSQNAFY